MLNIIALFLLIVPTQAGATPFTVDGSTVYVSGGQVGIATASPQTTLDVNGATTIRGSITASSGTFTLTGTGNYALALSTSITFTQSAGNGLGIRWGDGTISTTAASGSSSSNAVISFATASFVTTTSLTQTQPATTFAGCIATTTFLIASGNYYPEVIFQGLIVAANDLFVWVLMDGAFMGSLSGTSTTLFGNVGGNQGMLTSFIIGGQTKMSAGNHRACIGFGAGSGNITMYDSADANATKGHSVLRFQESAAPSAY